MLRTQRKGSPCALLMGMQVAAAATERSAEGLKKLNYHIIQQFYFWYWSKENGNANLKRYMYPCLHCSIVYKSKI